MHPILKNLITCFTLAVLGFGTGMSRSAQADLPAADLLRGISNVAANLAARDQKLGRLQQAAIWSGWAEFYRGYALQCSRDLKASTYAALNAGPLPRIGEAAEAKGLLAYARLCRAGAGMWQNMADQIARGGEVI